MNPSKKEIAELTPHQVENLKWKINLGVQNQLTGTLTREEAQYLSYLIEAAEQGGEEQCPGCMGPCGNCEPPSPELDAGELEEKFKNVYNTYEPGHAKRLIFSPYELSQLVDIAKDHANSVLSHHQKQWEEREGELVDDLTKIYDCGMAGIGYVAQANYESRERKAVKNLMSLYNEIISKHTNNTKP